MRGENPAEFAIHGLGSGAHARLRLYTLLTHRTCAE
jgi:hypothetical protein